MNTASSKPTMWKALLLCIAVLCVAAFAFVLASPALAANDDGDGVQVADDELTYIPVTLRIYKESVEGYREFVEYYPYWSAEDEKAYAGGTFIVGYSFATMNQPLGYVCPSLARVDIPYDATEFYYDLVYQEGVNFKVRFNSNDGTSETHFEKSDLRWTASLSSFADEVGTPSRRGYTFTGWNSEADGSGEDYDSTATFGELFHRAHPDVDGFYIDFSYSNTLNLYAQWEESEEPEVSYGIVYDLNNAYDGVNILTQVPGWRSPLDVSTLAQSDVTWTQNGFDVSNDAELDAAPNGYEFDGWAYKTDDGDYHKIDNTTQYGDMSLAIDSENPQDQIILYALWKELEVEINYVSDDEEMGTVDRTVDKISAVTLNSDEAASSAGSPLNCHATANDGYRFVRWELVDAGAGASASTNVMNTIGADGSELSIGKNEDDGRLYAATYKAVFEAAEEFTLAYDANEGEGSIDSVSATSGANFALSTGEGFSRSGYALVGWNTEPGGTGTAYALGAESFTMPGEDVTLYAQWVSADTMFTISVLAYVGPEGSVTGGDGTISGGTFISADIASQVSYTVNEGYTFEGWEYTIVDPDSGEVIASGIVGDLTTIRVTGNVTIRACFESSVVVPSTEVTLSYAANGGTGTVSAVTAEKGSSLVLSDGSTLTRSDYVLSGWNTKANGLGTAYALGAQITMPDENVTLYAQWTRISYSVSISAHSGKEGTVKGGTGTVASGEKIPSEIASQISCTPKDGYVFKGWEYTITNPTTGRITGNGTANNLTDIKVTGDVAVKAKFEAKPDSGSGTGTNTGTNTGTGTGTGTVTGTGTNTGTGDNAGSPADNGSSTGTNAGTGSGSGASTDASKPTGGSSKPPASASTPHVHTHATTITPAKTSADGLHVTKCTSCGKASFTRVIPKIASVKLAATSFVYNGKKVTPKVIAKDKWGKSILPPHYTVTNLTDCRSVGTHKIKVTFKGDYKGSKTFKISITPKKTKVTSVTGTAGGIQVKWEPQKMSMGNSRISGYEVRYSTSSKMKGAKTKTVNGYANSGTTIGGLSNGATYYVQVRTFMRVNGKMYYSKWS